MSIKKGDTVYYIDMSYSFSIDRDNKEISRKGPRENNEPCEVLETDLKVPTSNQILLEWFEHSKDHVDVMLKGKETGKIYFQKSNLLAKTKEEADKRHAALKQKAEKARAIAKSQYEIRHGNAQYLETDEINF